MNNEAGKQILRRRVDETFATFGPVEANAILTEVHARIQTGGTVREWLDMIDTVVGERHPYLRFAQEPLH